jgi:cytochrome P450 family 103
MSEAHLREAPAEIATLSIAELEADPHAVFRRYRPMTPLVAHEAGGYIVLRLSDVEQLMNDRRAPSTGTKYPELRGVTEGVLFDMFDQGMLTANDAVHRRRRSPFSRTFAARMIGDLRPRLRKIADALIESWYVEGEVDLLERYAAQIPAQAISDLLGLPKGDIPYFTKLVYSVSRFFSFTYAPEDLPEIEAATRELHDYVGNLMSGRRGGLENEFLLAYLADAKRKGELSPVEIVVQIVMLIIGGTDTTRVAMATQVGLLLQHREQWEAVCRDPALIPGAVSEALRYEPSVASVGRHTVEDIELDGEILPAGKFVMLSTMSAMRDETVFSRPDVFDIRRTDHRRLHLVFGGGPHRCIGEALARAELEEGLAVLTARLPQLRLAGGPPTLHGHFAIRRMDDMRVRWPL